MKNIKFCVIGLGFFGYHLAIKLSEADAEVLAIDNHQDKIDDISDKVSFAVCMDSTDIKALKSLGLEEMDAVIVAIGEGFESSILTTAHLQELGVKKIYNRVTSKVHNNLLKLMGIDELLLPEEDAAEQLVNRLMVPGLIEAVRLDSEYGIFEVKAPEKFIGKQLIETNIRENYKLNLVTIKSKKISGLLKKEMLDYVKGVPKPDDIIEKDDIFVLFGNIKNLKEFID